MCEFENIPLNRKNNNCQQSKQVDAIIGQQVFLSIAYHAPFPFSSLCHQVYFLYICSYIKKIRVEYQNDIIDIV